MKILPYILPLVNHPDSTYPLYPHQAIMLDEWKNRDAFLLETKTGSGKTTAAALPLLVNKESAVFVYPTNQLIADQQRSIADLAQRQGYQVCLYTPDKPDDVFAQEYTQADVILARIDGLSLERWRKRKNYRSKGQALKELITQGKPTIVLTNPDVLFLLFAMRYSLGAEALAALQAYTTLVIDEFHLYVSVELAHALFMIYMGRNLGTFDRVALLSATPSPQVNEYLDTLLNPYRISAETESKRLIINERTATHQVELNTIYASSREEDDTVSLMRDHVIGQSGEFYALRQQHSDPDYIPAVVIVNSVIDAINLEEALVKSGEFKDNDIVPIRGLMDKSERKIEGKVLAVGTSAIEVGVDFKCSYLLFEAREAASFMQRFGRVGRHQPGKAMVLCEARVVAEMQKLPDEIQREDLERYIYSWYLSSDARAWFVSSEMGILTTFALAHDLLRTVEEDERSTDVDLKAVRNWVAETLESYCIRMNAERQFKAMRNKYRRMERGSTRLQWIAAYEQINSFRSSLPSEEVLDFMEKERGRKYKYSVDLKTLLQRAKGLRYIEKRGVLALKGYVKWQRVWVMGVPDNLAIGTIYETQKDSPNLKFYQEGHLTSVSHLMTLQNHIFVLAPKSLRRHLDWRIAVFECGNKENLIAFDEDALLVYEIYNRIYSRRNRVSQRNSVSRPKEEKS